MAATSGRDVKEWIVEVASIYPAAIRHGGGYWSEIVANAASHAADVLEALIRVARQPENGGAVLGDLLEQSRQYVISNGSTFERILLDFNQAIVSLGRAYPGAAATSRTPEIKVDRERMVDVFRQFADFAASEALRLHGGKEPIDPQALRRQIEVLLAALQRLEGDATAVTPEPDRPRGGASS
jgi:hypothetical protein